MKISINWLRDFINIPKETDLNDLAHKFTLHSAEVEHTFDTTETYNNIVVGQIKEIKPHPDADKLKIALTDIGNNKLAQIVCGGANIKEGMYTAVALKGAKVKWHGKGDLVTLEKTKIRGIESEGMICAGEEIGLSKTPEGVLNLKDITKEELITGTNLAHALKIDDFIFEIDNKSLTHRPDLWGHYGIAREISAITGEKLKKINSKVNYPKKNSLKIEVKDKKLCPRYIGVLIENIKIQPSPTWMQERLEKIGIRSLNNIVDATNYVMAELGQPMHAFDADKIKGGIIVRTAKEGEKITLLDGATHTLTKEMLIIADHATPIAIAGVMGGADSEVTPSTTRIIIESANFNPITTRKTSTKIGLRTEAVQRFEKSLDPILAETAINKICELIQQISPQAKIASAKTDIASFNTKPITTTLNIKRLNSKVGKNIPKKEITNILKSLEFKIIKETDKELEIQIPSFRATKDISMEEDIIEEITRIHGYENIEPKLPDLQTKIPIKNIERTLKHKSREILSTGLGFTEVYNYSFYSKKDLQNSLLQEKDHIQIENYLSEEQTHLRTSLIPNLLKNVKENSKSFTNFNIYEIGKIYTKSSEYFPKEEKYICGIMAKSTKNEIFYDISGATEKFLTFFNTTSLKKQKPTSKNPLAHPSKHAIWYDRATKTKIAEIYELHPLIAKNYDLKNIQIGIFEINFTLLAQKGIKQVKYKPISKYPEINFDVSVIIKNEIEIELITESIKQADKELITNIKLFDIFKGESIGKENKAVAFTITLQAFDRTLTDNEMKQIQQKVFKNLQKIGGKIRGL